MIGQDEDGKFRCTLCGKTMSARHHMRNHVETHMAMTHSCDVPACRKVFKTRNSKAVHYSTYHKGGTMNMEASMEQF